MQNLTTSSSNISYEQQVKNFLKSLCHQIGVNPDSLPPEQGKKITEYIIDNLENFTIYDIAMAVKIGLAGKLDINLSHYQNFSSLYISNLMQSYDRYKIQENKKEKFKLLDPPEAKDWPMSEKQSHFEWLRDEVFLDNSGRNGKKGTFPKIVVASFKDIYDYMLHKGMLIELAGNKLKDRIDEAIRSEKSESSNPIGSMINKSRNESKIPPCFYRHEILRWFDINREKLY